MKYKKIIKVRITEKMQREMNEIRKICLFEEEPIKKDYVLEVLLS